MSRFGNLEFDREFDREFREAESPQSESHFLAGARQAFENGEFEKALRWFAKVLEFNPQNAAAWTGQVRALIELGEFREATLWASKALEQFPREPELLAAKAVALGRAGEREEALAYSDASIEERGDTPYIWLARGDVLLARAESRADYCFDKALALAPGDWVTAWLAARIRFFYRQFAVALKLLQQAIELNTTHFLLWMQLGQCQLALGLAGPAARSFQQARELNPQCDAARLGSSQAASAGVGSRLRGFWRRLFHS
ncbi:MAG TPA: tetratricopeptide repeat protein [Verrucomicrobiae bacterium]